MPRALEFLVDIGGSDNFVTAFAPGKYFTLITYMMLAFGIGFEFPILLIFLQMVGVLDVGTLKSGRRYAIVGICILVAVITPSGDPISMLMLSVPDGPLLRDLDHRRAHPGAAQEDRRSGLMADRAELLAGYDFALDGFQLRALDAIDAGRSVLVAAPTGSGKTVVAEYAVAKALAEGGKAFYTAPIKALSNQKYTDLARRHGTSRVGLLTGDNSINGDAPIVVMTTEVLRNMIYAGSPALTDLRYVVLDEVHFLQDAYRGAVWEEVMIHLAPTVDLVCLSATVSNAEELAEWITTVRGPTEAVIEERRPVELSNLYCVGDKSTQDLHLLPTLVDGRPNQEAERLDDEALHARPGGARGRPRRRFFTPRRLEVIERLQDESMLPAITFIFSRVACDEARDHCLDAGLRLTTAEERARIRHIVDERTSNLGDADLDILGYDRFLAALEAGIAAHHAGMVPPFKEAVEACFVEGLTKAVFATETLALGVNMPARSVVIERLTKFNGETREILTPGEYTQLTGRAGRRGIDDVGYAIVLWSPFVPFEQVAALASSRTYALRSAFRPTYNMAANLVRRYEPEQAHHLLNLSFAQFQADKAVVRIEARIERQQQRLERLRAEATCERGDVEEYRRLRATAEDARRSRPKADRADTDRTYAALTRLVPGDVLVIDGTRVAVLSVAIRKGHPRLHVVDDRSKPRTLGADDLVDPPRAVGSIELPEPYNPNNRAFQHQVGEALRRARTISRKGEVLEPEPLAPESVAVPDPVDVDLRRGGGPSRRRLPGPRRPRPVGGPGRPRRARPRRPPSPGAGPHGVAGPALRSRPAPPGGVGLPRRLGPHRGRHGPGPDLPRGRPARRRGDDDRHPRRPRRPGSGCGRLVPHLRAPRPRPATAPAVPRARRERALPPPRAARRRARGGRGGGRPAVHPGARRRLRAPCPRLGGGDGAGDGAGGRGALWRRLRPQREAAHRPAPGDRRRRARAGHRCHRAGGGRGAAPRRRDRHVRARGVRGLRRRGLRCRSARVRLGAIRPRSRPTA